MFLKAHKERDYREDVTFFFSITGVIFLPIFALNNLFYERYLLGIISFIVIAFLAMQALAIYANRYHPLITLFGLAPAIILHLNLSIYQQGIIGVLWCYPAVVIFHLIMRRTHAAIASIVLFTSALLNAYQVIEIELITRSFTTLLVVIVFSVIFVSIIEKQHSNLIEKELQKRDSMVSASHELRTPLATLMARVEAIRDGIRTADQYELAAISHSIEHITALVDDLYLLSLADVDQLKCNQDPEYLDEIIAEIAPLMEDKLSERDITLNLKTSASKPVAGDGKRLRQIIVNLLDNCYKYTSSGGVVSLITQQDENTCTLNITDTGPGVSDEVLSRLFDRFYREDKSRSRKTGGSGIGLSLVKVLTEAQQGQAKVYHAKEGGIGIQLTFPLYL